MTTEKRPEWTHQTKEDLARWLVGNRVTKITHHWGFTGVDTSRSWLTLHSKDNGTRDVDTSFFSHNREFEFAPDHAGLVSEVSYANVSKTIDLIDKFEKANARDRSEYERLKQKFGAR